MLDSGALLNTPSFLHLHGAAIPPSVADEIKTRAPLLDAYVENGIVRIEQPEQRYVSRVKKVAREAGELDKLSKTDIDVLALALQLDATLVTDDYHVQNVAAVLGIPFEGVTGEIKEQRRWVKRCSACGKTFPYTYRGKRCPHCGGKIVVIPQRRSSPRRNA